MKNNIKKHWSEAEDGLLKEMYFKGNIDNMLYVFQRSWDAIKLHAAKLKLNRWAGFYRKSDLSILLEETPETIYWIGFLLADGHFSKKSRLQLTLAIKDEEHVKSFAKYINADNINYGGKIYKNVSLYVQDIEIIPQLVNRYNISSNKTENPPNLSTYNLSKDKFISLFVGFIDGDGSIQKRVYNGGFLGRIKCHSSWLSNIQFMRNKLCEWLENDTTQKPEINKQGYTEWCITAGMLRTIKQEAERLQLPILKRKWDVVVPANERILNEEMTNYVCSSTKRTIDLANELNINYTTIYQARTRHGCSTASVLCFKKEEKTIRGNYEEIKNIIGCSKATIYRNTKVNNTLVNGWLFIGYERL